MVAIPDGLTESDLTALSDAELASAFNTVYTEYVVPFTMTEASARHHTAVYSIAREHSILWRDESGAVVGIGALGVRGERGWVGGFGLAVPWRGRGLAGPLVDRLIDRAREAGLRRVQLEVITSNERAIRTYERAGFRKARDLLVLGGRDGVVSGGPAAELHETDPLALLTAPPLAPATPPWQREVDSLIGRPDLHGVLLGRPDTPRAFAVVSLAASAASISMIAGESEEALVALADALATHFPDHALRIGNEPEESPIPPAFLRAGWREMLRQHEMIREL